MATAFDIHQFDDSIVIPALHSQLGFALDSEFPVSGKPYFSAPEIDLSLYHKIIIFMSAGKDSLACLLHLIDLGVDLSKVELWHHLV